MLENPCCHWQARDFRNRWKGRIENRQVVTNRMYQSQSEHQTYISPLKGILMSLSLFGRESRLHLVSAYESGEVILRRHAEDRDISISISISGQGWECLWRTRQHIESGMFPPVSMQHAKDAMCLCAEHLSLSLSCSHGDDRFR